ncbi:MAG: HDOD domain-containing protein [Pseudomonadota bacterium]
MGALSVGDVRTGTIPSLLPSQKHYLKVYSQRSVSWGSAFIRTRTESRGGFLARDDVWEIDLEEDSEVSDGLDSSVLKLISEQIEQLPPFPLVVNQVLRVIESPSCSLVDLSKVILNDPSLTGKILQIINSAYYGFAGKISTVSHAVSLLGTKEIKNLALSLPINDSFFSKKKSCRLNQSDLWIHSLSVGACARAVAERVKYPLPEEAFIAGLLHDIGKNVLNDVFPDKFDQVLHRTDESGLALVDVEKDMLTISHDTIGYWLAQHWKLPDSLTTAIQNHHSPLARPAPDDGKGKRLEAIIFLGNMLAKFLSLGFSGDKCIPSVKREVLDHLSLNTAAVVNIAESVQQSIQPMLRPFGIEIDLQPMSDEDKMRLKESLKG